MAKAYIVEELRVTGGSMRLHDSITDALVDVATTRRNFVAGGT